MQLKIDENIAEKVIPADDSVRLLDQIVEEMDKTPLKRAYNRHGRRPATAPSTLLKILLYANMENIFSSRDIEKACKRDINFIWLLNGAKAPNYHEISRFMSIRLAKCADELFYGLVEKLHDIGEITYEHLFVDGTKTEANANKYSFVRMNRSIQSEGAFGVAKQNYGFRQFLLRGNLKVTTEVLILAMASCVFEAKDIYFCSHMI